MSQNDPEALRADIARTRAALSDNVDTLTETANPKNIADRQVNKVKGAARGVREHLMGAPDDSTDGGTVGETTDAVKDKLGSVKAGTSNAVDTVADTPRQVRNKARGNPLAAGLIAFGIGYLISSAIPSSEKEQRAASKLQEKAAPLTDKVSEAAGEVAGRLQEPAQDAAASLKAAATDAVDSVKEQGATAKGDVQGQVQDSTTTVRDNASSS